MGLGRIFTRNLEYQVTDTDTGAVSSYEIVIDKGLYPSWGDRHYRGGMKIPGAWRAALLLSDLLGSLPWDAYRRRAGVLECLDPTPPLLDQPNPEESRMDTISAWALDLIWHGNAVGLVAARNAEGWPTAVLPVPAEIVMARRVGPGAYAGGIPYGTIEYDIGGQRFSPYDVVHVKGPHAPGELRGMGVLEMHIDGTLALAQTQAAQAQSLSQHGVPTGLLKVSDPDATQDEMTQVKTKWLAAQASRTIAVLNSVTDFTPLAWNPEELQLVEARKYSLTELALIFGVPGYFLGADSPSMTYSNVEQEGLNLLKYSLSGHLARFEQTLSRAFPRGTYVKANLDALLRPDTLTRYQAHQVGITAGFLTIDEARRIEDLPPLPDQPEMPAEDSSDQMEGDTEDASAQEDQPAGQEDTAGQGDSAGAAAGGADPAAGAG